MRTSARAKDRLQLREDRFGLPQVDHGVVVQVGIDGIQRPVHSIEGLERAQGTHARGQIGGGSDEVVGEHHDEARVRDEGRP